jgi:hypothetical protein
MHQVHDVAWDAEEYRRLQIQAMKVLARLANEERDSSTSAAIFAALVGVLDVDSREGRKTLFDICMDWLGGRIGPIGEVSIRTGSERADMTAILLAATLEHETNILAHLESLLESQKKETWRLEGELKKRRKDLAREREANLGLRRQLNETMRSGRANSWQVGAVISSFSRFFLRISRTFWRIF